MATHTVNTGHGLPDISNMTLINHVSLLHTGTIMNMWENSHICKHKTQDKLTNANQHKHGTIFKILNTGNTQKTNTHTHTQ